MADIILLDGQHSNVFLRDTARDFKHSLRTPYLIFKVVIFNDGHGPEVSTRHRAKFH